MSLNIQRTNFLTQQNSTGPISNKNNSQLGFGAKLQLHGVSFSEGYREFRHSYFPSSKETVQSLLMNYSKEDIRSGFKKIREFGNKNTLVRLGARNKQDAMSFEVYQELDKQPLGRVIKNLIRKALKMEPNYLYTFKGEIHHRPQENPNVSFSRVVDYTLNKASK